MQLSFRGGLVFVEAEVEYRGKRIHFDNVILDTGSVGTLFSADLLETIGVLPESGDPVLQISGVGGIEVVYTKRVDVVRLGDQSEGIELRDLVVEIGAMEYDFAIDGIIGINFLFAVGAVINLSTLTISSANNA